MAKRDANNWKGICTGAARGDHRDIVVKMVRRGIDVWM